jgi:hypothetical protein
MMRLKITLPLTGIALSAILITNCVQVEQPTVTTEPSPTPDTSIVWSEDFEDGDWEGWEIGSTSGGEFFIEDGVLKVDKCEYSAFVLSAIGHLSPITTGTWSFDLYFHGQDFPTIGLFGNLDMDSFVDDFNSPDSWWNRTDFRSLGLQVHMRSLYLTTFIDGKHIMMAHYKLEDHLGWQHFDVTRDDGGRTLVYLNGKQIYDYTDDSFNNSKYFYILTYEDSAFDNIVVRDQVLNISQLNSQ